MLSTALARAEIRPAAARMRRAGRALPDSTSNGLCDTRTLMKGMIGEFEIVKEQLTSNEEEHALLTGRHAGPLP